MVWENDIIAKNRRKRGKSSKIRVGKQEDQKYNISPCRYIKLGKSFKMIKRLNGKSFIKKKELLQGILF